MLRAEIKVKADRAALGDLLLDDAVPAPRTE
jgi:cbb3-type cytochrome oxidase subunit 3